jgi:bifunctional DNA-binding transcriptional regulator/antitoxin component of YhaV-PrlF toxin-antitoxin module
MVASIVTVTKKGQATIPKSLREKHKIGKKAIAIDTKEGVLFKPVSGPTMEKGSLITLFKGKTSKQLIKEARSQEAKKERRLLRADRQ